MLPEYTYRLIAGVREEIKKHMRDTFYGATYPAEWMDAVLLCDVVEEDRIKVDAELAKKEVEITEKAEYHEAYREEAMGVITEQSDMLNKLKDFLVVLKNSRCYERIEPDLQYQLKAILATMER